jgi:hypothetical protein
MTFEHYYHLQLKQVCYATHVEVHLNICMWKICCLLPGLLYNLIKTLKLYTDICSSSNVE